MQAIAPATAADFREPVQKLIYRFEVHDGSVWQDLTALGGSGGKNYLKSISISLGGAGMTTQPIAGNWSATLDNELGIFHPKHPSSPYANLFRVGREVRISVGGIYGGSEHYWQRMIGFMGAPNFNHGDHTLAVEGMDYMKLLADTNLRDVNAIAESGSGSGSFEVDAIINGPLHWGARAVFDSVASPGGTGSEIYVEADACNTESGEADSVGSWTTGGSGTLTSEGPAQESLYFLRLERSVDWPTDEYIENPDVGSLTAGTQYTINFWARIVYNSSLPGAYARLLAMQGSTPILGKVCSYNGGAWTNYSFHFTAISTAALKLRFISSGQYSRAGDYVELDDISITEYDPTSWMRYDLPAACNGPYFVTLDGEPVGQGDQEEGGWHYIESTRSLFFNEDMTINAGTDNIYIYYYTDQLVDNVLADILVWCGLYANRPAALADMDYTPTGLTLGRVWFDSNSTALAAIGKICERVNYRFWFSYEGKPCFHPAPVADSIDYDFPDWGDLQGLSEFQDEGMIRNRVVIEGIQRAMYQVGREDKASDRYKAEAEDPTSIGLYLEKTYSIQNHLFQDQTSVSAMVAEMLAEFKDPKWYASLSLFANPVPLEMGDVISWKAQLEPTPVANSDSGALEIDMMGIIRDIKISDHQVDYKVEIADEFASSSGSVEPVLYFWNHEQNAIYSLDLGDFATSELIVSGGSGSGSGEFDHVRDFCRDGEYLFVCDQYIGIKKFRISDGQLVAEQPVGDHLSEPVACVVIGSTLYVCNQGGVYKDIISKWAISDLAYISSFGSTGSGDNNFDAPCSIDTDGTYLYITDYGNSRVKKHQTDGTFLAEFGSAGSGDNNLSMPSGLATDGTYVYVVDANNYRIQVLNCSDLTRDGQVDPNPDASGESPNMDDIAIVENYFYFTVGWSSPVMGIQKFDLATRTYQDTYDYGIASWYTASLCS